MALVFINTLTAMIKVFSLLLSPLATNGSHHCQQHLSELTDLRAIQSFCRRTSSSVYPQSSYLPPCFFKVLKSMLWQLFPSWSVFNLGRRKATVSQNVNSDNIRNRMWTFRFTALCWVYTLFCLQSAAFLLFKNRLKFLLLWRKRMTCEVQWHHSCWKDWNLW